MGEDGKEQEAEGSGREGFEQINTKLKFRIYIITVSCNTVIGIH